jgi:hypothetical protein
MQCQCATVRPFDLHALVVHFVTPWRPLLAPSRVACSCRHWLATMCAVARQFSSISRHCQLELLVVLNPLGHHSLQHKWATETWPRPHVRQRASQALLHLSSAGTAVMLLFGYVVITPSFSQGGDKHPSCENIAHALHSGVAQRSAHAGQHGHRQHLSGGPFQLHRTALAVRLAQR